MTRPADAEDVRSAMTGRWLDFYSQFTELKDLAGEYRGRCPIHNGSGPNFAVNPETGLYNCFSSCGDGGDVFTFLQRLDGITFPEAVERVAAFVGLSADRPGLAAVRREPRPIPAPTPPAPFFLDPCIAEEMHQRLLNCNPMRLWLSEERGLATETLIRFRLGLHKDKQDEGFFRVCFPVFNRQGRLINIRRHLFAYRPELTPERRRMLGKTKPWGAGLRAHLYPISALVGAEEALIVEGEADAVLACQMGFAAVTGTGGAGTWKPEWTDELRGLKRVTVMYDDDSEGQKGTEKVAAALSGVVSEILIGRLQRTRK